MIKKIIPVPDTLTSVILITQIDGVDLCEDAERNGTPVFLTLTDEDEVLPYVIDSTGIGELGDTVQYRPAVCCPKCGQKMRIMPHKDLSEPLVYECPGGDCMRRVSLDEADRSTAAGDLV